MKRTLHYLLLFVFVGLSGSALAQEILGTVIDKKTKEPLVNASISVKQGGISKGGAVTDFDGNYSVKPLEPGFYDVTVSYAGYQVQTRTGVIVSPGAKTGLDVTLSSENILKEAIIKYRKPVVNKYVDNRVMTAEEIKNKPTTQTADLVALAPGAYQKQRGGELNSDGGRGSGNIYIVDGVQVQSNTGNTGIDQANGSIAQLEVISSGIPANYGDVSGAVINITSKGVSQKFGGSAKLQHSIDGYNNNLASFSISGPLLKKKQADTSKPALAVMGFALSGDYYNDNNRFPYYDKQYEVKSDVLADLQKNPLKIVSDNSGNKVYNLASQYVTKDQMNAVKRPSNNNIQELRLNGKVDYKMTDNMRVAVGGSFTGTKADAYSRIRNMFATESTPIQYTYTGRGYIRFTQKFGKQGYQPNDSSKKSIISNAYYTVQVDYQRYHQLTEDQNFKKNIFNYQYIGNFATNYRDVYLPNQVDSASQRTGTVFSSRNSTGIDYTRSNLNTNLANYTTQYYNSIGDNKPTTIQQIQAKNALVNGDNPGSTYSLFLSPGATYDRYSIYNSNQYSLTVDAAFDLKLGGQTHNIEFGLYYQQRIIRSLSISANNGTSSLWQQMRQLVSSVDNGNLKLDKANPIFVVNHQQYSLADVNSGIVRPGPADTILYRYINPVQTPFDKNLREKLKLGPTENINIDALDPSKFSLDLFTADELLNSGKSFTDYYGYGYAGQAQTGTVNFNDFWTQKDAKGNYTRPIGAFTPNYIAGYILDKFEYKNILFNIGVRIERYSANTKVLKDPYSLYGVKTIAQTSSSEAVNSLNRGVTPSNLSSDAVVYVDDNNSTGIKNIIGYRQGNNWYDYSGKFIESPAVLKNYSGGRDPQPLLSDPNKRKITDTAFNPNTSFTDYTPQVTVMPRIALSFPISQTSKFVAHYDIYSQRPYPTSLGVATAADYYYLQQNANILISNANLKPQKTFDYELGFEQAIGRDAVLKINGFYKERKDMVAVAPYLFAYPTTYYTYGNRDFSTTKGVKAYYEMLATKHLSLSVSYTLQFAEGTGSSPYSANAGDNRAGAQIAQQGLLQTFIEAGLPNLRYVSSLDYDARHNIVASFDYRFADGEGPVVKGKHIFQNAGIDLIAKTRSGEPFTRTNVPEGRTIIGGINGSRLPWHFGMDMKINKDFAFDFGKKNKDIPAGLKARRVQKVAAYIYVQNLLNTREILGVYGYTGRPDDNGFLSSAYGAQAIPNQVSPQSYQDIYSINKNDPNNLNYARTINFGLEYNF